MVPQVINVDLTEQDLRLMICGICKAITLQEHAGAHAYWHLTVVGRDARI